MFYYYSFVAAFILLLVYAFYQHVCSIGWDESEIRHLERMELNVANILRLIDAPDVRMLLNDPKARENLFMEFSAALRQDVTAVCRWGGIRAGGFGLLAAFFVAYYLMRAKAHLFCGPRDLHFLSGLELAFVRSVRS